MHVSVAAESVTATTASADVHVLVVAESVTATTASADACISSG
jgi:hypothetical protein